MANAHTRESAPKEAPGRPARRRRSWKFRLLAVLLALLMCAMSIPLFVVGTLLGRTSRPGETPVEFIPPPEGAVDSSVTAPPITNVELRPPSAELINILLVGVDTRSAKSFSGLSDSMMILTIDTRLKQIRLTSLLRDTFVSIPRSPNPFSHKLNAAYSTGGIALLQKTLRERYAMQIDEYVVINFAGLSAVVDKLGGVTLEVTAQESGQIPSLTRFSGAPRTVTLNGKQALAYARIRHIDDDFRRTGRQQNVINAIFAEVKSMGVTGLTGLLYDFLPYVMTNIGDTQLLRYAADMAATYRSYPVRVGYHVPQDGCYRYDSIPVEGGLHMSVVSITDWNKSVLDMHRYIYNGEE